MLTSSFLTLLSTVLVTLHGVHAQANPQLEVESIDAQFDNSYLVPDLLATFDPVAYLTVSYNGAPVSAGTLIAVNDTQTAPTITITAANSTVTLPSTLTLAMVDPGAIGKLSTPGPTRHWLVNGVTVGSNGALVIPETSITAYGAPYPDEADAPHRYAIVLWDQPSTFAPQGDLATGPQPITQFNLNDYVTSSGLGRVVAAWYFTCTRGTAVAPTETSAVDTATLPAAQSASHSGSSHASTSTSSTGSGSGGSGSGNGALGSVSFAPAGVAAALGAAVFGVFVA
ncbi:hypothetical protein FRC15_007215 [Serendipita sp. 397]|nr:hypothetical protein FRC15_007215 [Serendipita sp. 397]KAG8768588.1 hypothetical protein FRC16_006978 [Serendipita sp. 398]